MTPRNSFNCNIPKANNVHIVINNTVNITRRELLSWLQKNICSGLKRIEDLANGVVYCQIMEKLFPGCIPFYRIKSGAVNDSEAFGNYKLLLNAFKKHDVKKDIPVHMLIRGVFSENFRFAQWFKLFYEANCTSSRILQKQGAINCAGADLNTFGDHCQPRRPSSAAERAMSVSTFRTSAVSNRRKSSATPTSPQGIKNAIHNRSSSAFSEKSMAPAVEPIPRKLLFDVSCEESQVFSDFEVDDSCESALIPGRHMIVGNPSAPEVLESSVKSPSETEQQISVNSCTPLTIIPRPKLRSAATTSLQLPPPSPSLNFKGQKSLRRSCAMGNIRECNFHSVGLLAAGDRPTTDGSNVSVNNESVGRRTSLDNTTDIHSCESSPHQPKQDFEKCQKNFRPICTQLFNRLNNAAAPSPHFSDLSLKSNTVIGTKGDEQYLGMRSMITNSADAATQMGPLQVAKHMTTSPLVDWANVSNAFSFNRGYRSYFNVPSGIDECIERNDENILRKEIAQLQTEMLAQRELLFCCEKERKFYFEKLRKLEQLCLQGRRSGNTINAGFLDAILTIMYETEEGFQLPDEAEVCV